MGIKNAFKKAIINLPGKRIKDKVIVFESDDWGMIRTSSKEAFNVLSKKYPLQNCNYSKYDALERKVDVSDLLEVLNSNKSEADIYNTPKFTLNYVTHNPDFDKIQSNGFSNYFRETNETTYHRYPNSSEVLNLVKDGILQGLFQPQYHATEHININNWLLDLSHGDEATQLAFSYRIANLHKENVSTCGKEHLDAFGYRAHEKYEALEKTLEIGLNEFQRIFGYASTSLIAPCYFWNERLESAAIKLGVQVFQGGTVQKVPLKDGAKYVRHFMGQKGGMGQRYFIRNCQFERVDNPNINWVDSCLYDVNWAFQCNKPAIISTHRVNYIGRLNENNKTMGLEMLNTLLKKINKKWQGVLYMDSATLYKKYYK
jgi:hypothetical protein